MKYKITLTFNDGINPINCGFRQNWIDGERGKGAKKEKINLSCGAGTGQPWLIFSKMIGNAPAKYLVADIREVISQLSSVEK